jgi:hypothetical protein
VLGNEHAGFGGRPRGKGPAHAGTSPRGRPYAGLPEVESQKTQYPVRRKDA